MLQSTININNFLLSNIISRGVFKFCQYAIYISVLILPPVQMEGYTRGGNQARIYFTLIANSLYLQANNLVPFHLLNVRWRQFYLQEVKMRETYTLKHSHIHNVETSSTRNKQTKLRLGNIRKLSLLLRFPFRYSHIKDNWYESRNNGWKDDDLTRLTRDVGLT